MGLFDSLLNAGKKAISEAAADKLSEAVNDKLGGVMDGLSSMTQGLDEDTFGNEAKSYTKGTSESSTSASVNNASGNREVSRPEDKLEFSVKLRRIIESAGDYQIIEKVSPDELEQECGHEIYPRGVHYAEPDDISFKIMKGGERVLYIRLWHSSGDYNHVANLKIKYFCEDNGIKILDFFENLPNRYDYMEKRIKEKL